MFKINERNVILSETNKVYEDGCYDDSIIFEQQAPDRGDGMFLVSKETVAALYICGRCQKASTTQRGNVGNTQSLQVDEIIELFARQHHFWFENTDKYFHEKYGSPISFGSESNVYLDEQRQLVVKTIDTEVYGSIVKALRRVVIHNSLFPETSLNVIGFGRSQFGLFEFIAEQPYIQGRYATIEEIKDKLLTIGAKECNGDFYTEKYIISDIKPKNAIITAEGKIFIIDSYLEYL